mmetsp:Transcript_63243/g.184808  ORF Transcript_63243/g.184808 Transcript_63243/m.184808 type:complete len:430 (+) Transcript_63243:283-1572(+)
MPSMLLFAPQTNPLPPSAATFSSNSSKLSIADASIITTSLSSRITAFRPTTFGTSCWSRPAAAPKVSCPFSCTTAVPAAAAASVCLMCSGAPEALAESKTCTPFSPSWSLEALKKNMTMASAQPAATATMRSTKTVVRNVTASTRHSARGSPGRRLSRAQSTTSRPDLMRMAARQERGTYCAREPRPRTAAKSTTECVAPEIGVRPPVRTFTTVRMVAPAPAWPPKSPATVLPIPCPTSSRSLLWKEEVMESATSDVSRESTAPSTAKVRAVGARLARKTGETAGRAILGKPIGMAPSDGTTMPKDFRTTASVKPAMTNAKRGRGTLKVSLWGNLYSMKRVRKPMPSAGMFTLATAPGSFARAVTTWPPPEWPSSTGSWREQMMPPTPVMKPERTVRGTRRMAPPSLSTPMAICIRPAMTTTRNTTAGS